MNNIQSLINKKLKAIHRMIEECIPDAEEVGSTDLNEIKERHELLIEQVKFWEEQDNQYRILYDLQNFGDWLFSFLELEDFLNEEDEDKDF